MKKFSIAMAILAAMVFTACNNNDAVVIRLNETELELVKGETKQLTATILPAEANPAFEWFSSNPECVQFLRLVWLRLKSYIIKMHLTQM